VDREVREVFADAAGAFRAAGARMKQASPDMREVPEIVRLSRGLLMVARHAEKLPRHRDVLQAGLVENTEQGLALTAADVARGELLRTTLWHRVREFLDGCDVWITPTTAMPPFLLEQPALGRSFLTYAFSVLGLPAMSVPAGFTFDGLPIGLQIVGRRGGETAVLRAAAAFEAVRPWAYRIPSVVPRAYD
jgi:amidase